MKTFKQFLENLDKMMGDHDENRWSVFKKGENLPARKIDRNKEPPPEGEDHDYDWTEFEQQLAMKQLHVNNFNKLVYYESDVDKDDPQWNEIVSDAFDYDVTGETKSYDYLGFTPSEVLGHKALIITGLSYVTIYIVR